MQSVQKLKKELEFNTELTQLLDILKSIAASEFHFLEKRRERFAKFMQSFDKFFQLIDFKSARHPFAEDKTGRMGIIMITSDEGFMGGLNTQVINTALSYPGADMAELIIVGERGAAYLKGLRRKFSSFAGITSEGQYEAAVQLKDYIMKEALQAKFTRLILVYPKPITFVVQEIEILKILPCSELFEESGSFFYTPQLFERRENVVKDSQHVIIESSLSDIIEYLVATWITEKLFEVFEDSKLAELSARTLHLEKSHQTLQQAGKLLRFKYFRSYHDLIDKGMRESFSASIMRRRKG